jgi:hypothetical protein
VPNPKNRKKDLKLLLQNAKSLMKNQKYLPAEHVLQSAAAMLTKDIKGVEEEAYEVYTALVDTLFMQSKYKQTVPFLQKSLKVLGILPQYDDALSKSLHTRLAAVYSALGDNAQAVVAYAKVFEHFEEDTEFNKTLPIKVFAFYALALNETAKHEKALEYAKQGIAHETPENPIDNHTLYLFHREAAIAYNNMERYADGMNMYLDCAMRLERQDPIDTETFKNLMDYYGNALMHNAKKFSKSEHDFHALKIKDFILNYNLVPKESIDKKLLDLL